MADIGSILIKLGPVVPGESSIWVGPNYSKADLRQDLQDKLDYYRRSFERSRLKPEERTPLLNIKPYPGR